MASPKWLFAFTLVAAAAPAAAGVEDRMAPAGTADTRDCMRVELTGHVVQRVKCWTRDEWAAQGVDVDRDWSREGVRTID